MKFKQSACIDTLYTEIPFYDRFAAAKKDGFDYVEYWSWTDRDADQIIRAASDAGIGISGFNGDAEYSLIDPTHKEAYLEYLKKSVAMAQKVGALSVTIHSNALGEGGVVVNHYNDLSDTVKISSMYDMLLECARIAESGGIAMNLEPLNIIEDHVGNFLKYTRDAAAMTKLIGSPKLKVLYDVYHMQLNEGNLCGNIREHVSEIGHIHVADAPGRCEPGTGEINYSAVYQCLEESGYKGRIGYELYPKTTTAQAVQAIMSY